MPGNPCHNRLWLKQKTTQYMGEPGKVRLTFAASLVFVSMTFPAYAADFAALDASCTSYICVEAQTGLIVAEQNADERRAPASMVKLMQMLLVAEGVREGTIDLNMPIPISAEAQRMGGTQVWLKQGDEFPLHLMMRAVAVASANDAALAVAEGVWGSREEYLKQANKRAQELGMLDTEFHSPHGLPPEQGQSPDLSTARDLAKLAQQCVLESQLMEWVGQKDLQFKPNLPVKENTNKLLSMLPECDGLKTGYTRAAGFCLTATASRGGIRLISVVMGCDRLSTRFDASKVLLEDSFAQVRKVKYFEPGQRLDPPIPVHNSPREAVRLSVAEPVWLVMKGQDIPKINVISVLPPALDAPLNHGAVVGEMRLQLDGQTLDAVPLVLAEDLEEGSWRWKLSKSATAPAVLGLMPQ